MKVKCVSDDVVDAVIHEHLFGYEYWKVGDEDNGEVVYMCHSAPKDLSARRVRDLIVRAGSRCGAEDAVDIGIYDDAIPAYTKSPDKDYEVLCLVRRRWAGEKFGRFATMLGDYLHASGGAFSYLVGDYSRMAYTAIKEGDATTEETVKEAPKSQRKDGD